MLLRVEGVTASYGKREILHDVSINIGDGEIVSVVGPNGAGKSTLLRVIAGFLCPRQGKVIYKEEEITTLPAHLRVQRGIGYFMQGGEIFQNLTVRENLELAGHRVSSELFQAKLETVFKIFPALLKFRTQRAGLLSGGQRQMLALGMVLLQDPQLLMLDEPSAGLAPGLVKEIMCKIVEINRDLKVSIVLVEQNVREALKLSTRVYLLRGGKIFYEGEPQHLIAEQTLEKAFLS